MTALISNATCLLGFPSSRSWSPKVKGGRLGEPGAEEVEATFITSFHFLFIVLPDASFVSPPKVTIVTGLPLECLWSRSSSNTLFSFGAFPFSLRSALSCLEGTSGPVVCFFTYWPSLPLLSYLQCHLSVRYNGLFRVRCCGDTGSTCWFAAPVFEGGVEKFDIFEICVQTFSQDFFSLLNQLGVALVAVSGLHVSVISSVSLNSGFPIILGFSVISGRLCFVLCLTDPEYLPSSFDSFFMIDEVLGSLEKFSKAPRYMYPDVGMEHTSFSEVGVKKILPKRIIQVSDL